MPEDPMRRCAIGLVGWGTVGGGVIDLLHRDGAMLRERVGLDMHVARIVTRSPGRMPATAAHGAAVSSDIVAITGDPAIDVVVHAVGGTGAAKDLLLACLAAGKPVVTANKALIAEHGDELFAAADQAGVPIAFEAAVAGGIPVIAALRDGLVANRIEAIHAILNGTCNYILTMMELADQDFPAALAAAQRLGYAEADPTLDIDGTDTAHKLAILARIAVAGAVPVRAIRVEGIQAITQDDIASAARMGCRIKLIATARRTAGGLDLHVAPTLVPLDHPLAAVMRNHNGVFVEASNAGPQLFTGQGAGALPTASAVLADVVDVLIGRAAATGRYFSLFASGGSPPRIVGEAEEITGSYARFLVSDRPGVLAGIARVLGDRGISVQSLHQERPASDGRAVIEVLTHPSRGGDFLAAVAAIDAAGLTALPTVTLRRL
jgi:homoserine dehydrogenase